jgi:hypothetical protein
VCVITRLRLDAALYEPALPRQPRQNGRPRKKGKRLPTLEKVLTDSTTPWTTVTVANWYGGSSQRVQLTSDTAVWYHAGKPVVPIRWVVIRDPKGRFDPHALLATNQRRAPAQILTYFVRRWQLETTFEEARAHLGVETQRQWSNQATARTTPALLALYSIVTLMAAHLVGTNTMPVRTAAWYDKAHATFSDPIAAVAAGQPQALLPEKADDLAGGLTHAEGLEHQGQGVLRRAIGILDHATIVEAQPPGGAGSGQLTPLRLLLHAGHQPAAQGMEFRFAQAPCHPEEETAIGRRRIVDPLVVSHATLIRGTQIEPGVPIGTVAREPGALIAEQETHLPQGHLGQEGLIAIAPYGVLRGAPSVHFNDLDALVGPAEAVGMLPHGVWPLMALGSGEHLVSGRLPNVEHRCAVQMVRLNALGRRHRSPHRARWSGRR